MSEIEKITQAESQQVAEFKNPFSRDKVERIDISYRKKLFEDVWIWEGEVKFKNGQTSGRQEFVEAELPPLLAKIEQFIKNL